MVVLPAFSRLTAKCKNIGLTTQIQLQMDVNVTLFMKGSCSDIVI